MNLGGDFLDEPFVREHEALELHDAAATKLNQREVVLGVSLGGRTVGVVRMPDGALLFPSTVDVRGGVVLTSFEAHATTVDGCTVVAGRRMPGVARVVVIDDRGDEYEATVAKRCGWQ